MDKREIIMHVIDSYLKLHQICLKVDFEVHLIYLKLVFKSYICIDRI